MKISQFSEIEDYILHCLVNDILVSRTILADKFESTTTVNQVIWDLIERDLIQYSGSNWNVIIATPRLIK